MKCKECDSCRKGFFKSQPDAYVCIGVKNPFVIQDINHKCTEYPERNDENMDFDYKRFMRRLRDENAWDHHCAGSLTLKGRVETVKWAYNYIQYLVAELVFAKLERDAAVTDLIIGKECYSCKNRDNEARCDGDTCYTCKLDCACAKSPCEYEWRGICQENMGAQE